MFRGLIDKRHNIKILTDKANFYEFHAKHKVLTVSGAVLKYFKHDKDLICATLIDPVRIHYERSTTNE